MSFFPSVVEYQSFLYWTTEIVSQYPFFSTSGRGCYCLLVVPGSVTICPSVHKCPPVCCLGYSSGDFPMSSTSRLPPPPSSTNCIPSSSFSHCGCPVTLLPLVSSLARVNCSLVSYYHLICLWYPLLSCLACRALLCCLWSPFLLFCSVSVVMSCRSLFFPSQPSLHP